MNDYVKILYCHILTSGIEILDYNKCEKYIDLTIRTIQKFDDDSIEREYPFEIYLQQNIRLEQ